MRGGALPLQPATCSVGEMSSRPAKPTADASPGLSIPEPVLLFCVASDTDWEHAGITGTTVTAMIVRGFIQRDSAGGSG